MAAANEQSCINSRFLMLGAVAGLLKIKGKNNDEKKKKDLDKWAGRQGYGAHSESI